VGILHLMAWTACVAVATGVIRLTATKDSLGAYEGLFLLTVGLTSGTGLAGLATLIARRRRGYPFPVHSGEYLWVVHGLSFLIGQATILVVMAILLANLEPGDMTPVRRGVIYFSYGAPSCVSRLAMLWPAIRLSTEGRSWATFFWITFASTFAGSCTCTYVVALASPIALAVFVLLDRSRKVRYPWTHWVGIALELLNLVNAFAAVAVLMTLRDL
jgi:hypothetical protein